MAVLFPSFVLSVPSGPKAVKKLSTLSRIKYARFSPTNDYRDLAHLRTNIEAFIEQYYNRCRLHSALGYRPPEEFDLPVATAVRVLCCCFP